jgi:Ca2+-binding EF-hand superfamily protein
MKATFFRLSILTVCLVSGSMSTLAQQLQPQPLPQQDRPGRPPGGPGGLVRMSPLFTALDTNSDGTIDEKEIAGAVAALKKLDKNSDGKLTEDELRPTMARGGRAAPEMREGAGTGRNVDETVNRLMQFDKNTDGKLAKDEVPERMRAIFERGDKDKDGFLSKDEVKAVAEAPRPEGAPRRQGAPVPPSQ